MSSTSTPNNPSHLKRPCPVRLDRPAHSTRLTKPFRSPLKSSIAHHADAAEEAKASHDPTQTDTDAPSASTATPAADANTLQQQYRSISRQVTQMRQSLDTVQQAVNILQTDQKKTIETLIEKWTTVVRDAADELYIEAKERVESDGGLGRPRRRSYGDAFQEGEPHMTAEQQEMLQEQQDEDRAQALKYGLIESVEPADHDDDARDKVSQLHVFVSPLIHPQSFTMAMMLRQMNVDLQLVGYDEKEEQWKT